MWVSDTVTENKWCMKVCKRLCNLDSVKQRLRTYNTQTKSCVSGNLLEEIIKKLT